MISVIICSINQTFARQVQQNIADTIGVVFEVIVLDNTKNPQSITNVYNTGATKAQYNILCFVHEDVVFQTQNWGTRIIRYFAEDHQLGLIGIAGSKYKSATPSGWFTGISELDCCNIKHQEATGLQQNIYFNPVPGSLTQEVTVVDGVFMCCPKPVWQTVKFDEVLLTDFHLYDIDFSLRVAEKYKVMVTYEIELLHFAKGGHYGNKWLESTLRWHKHTRSALPAIMPGVAISRRITESKILKTWLIRLKHERITYPNKLSWLNAVRIWAHPEAWPFVILFLTKSLFKRKSNIQTH